jgi:hypothetical protein
MKKLIVFDLDGTFAESESPIDAETSGLLHDLLSIIKVAIISGGDWPQFEKQLVSNLSHDECLANLSLLPTCGTKFYRYDSLVWKKIYSEQCVRVRGVGLERSGLTITVDRPIVITLAQKNDSVTVKLESQEQRRSRVHQ